MFRIIPRTACDKNGNKEALVFLPDLISHNGNIACYARQGEHREASIGFYDECTEYPDQAACELALWYMNNYCHPQEEPTIQLMSGSKILFLDNKPLVH
jgi:hypothetical protein